MEGNDKKFLIIIGVVTVAIIAVGVYFINKASKPVTVDVPLEDITGTNLDYAKGLSSAPVPITVFSDFQCPACAQIYPVLDKVLEKNTNVRIIYRNFPLTNIHQNAMMYANAAEAAGVQEKFWPMHDQLFDNQDELAQLSGSALTDKLVTLAEAAGVKDLEKFRREVEGQVYNDKINADKKAAEDLKLRSTPTIFVGKTKVKINTILGLQDDLQKVIDNMDSSK